MFSVFENTSEVPVTRRWTSMCSDFGIDPRTPCPQSLSRLEIWSSRPNTKVWTEYTDSETEGLELSNGRICGKIACFNGYESAMFW